MRIIVHTGNSSGISFDVCSALAANRDSLRGKGVLYPFVSGNPYQSRLQNAASGEDIGSFFGPKSNTDSAAIANLRTQVIEEIAAEIRAVRPRLLIISLPNAFVMNSKTVILQLFRMLSEFTDDLHALIQIAPHSTAIPDFNELQIRQGAVEIVDMPPTQETLKSWKTVFGEDEVNVQEIKNSKTGIDSLSKVCGIDLGIAKLNSSDDLGSTSAARLIGINKLLSEFGTVSGSLRDRIHKKALENIEIDISEIVGHFQSEIKSEQKSKRVRARVQKRIDAEDTSQPSEGITEGGAKFLDANGKAQVEAIREGQFRPRNEGVVNFNEAITPPSLDIHPEIEPSGTLLIACIKNEAPYILEWIAHHQGIGVDEFLIFSNDCSDGSTEILDRLDEMGVIHHENNDKWKGKSPQQGALNSALKHTAYLEAKWVAHIDIDEFINLRWGETGTLPELYAMMGDATNLAMTWRMFGHNGIQDFADEPVIKQFTGAVPAYCPKPHTAWGFKTLLRNDGHYGKLSCHRPNKLVEGREDRVKWLNGSLIPMGENVNTQGWRSSVANIGYNAVQLNHYALRSADSFLVKRQRGRALHVDRSIGLNYWVRMDWNLHREMTIQRFLPRTEAGIAKLKSDPELEKWHQRGADWHRARAKELKQTAEFSELYHQATTIKLTDDERVAATLAADMES